MGPSLALIPPTTVTATGIATIPTTVNEASLYPTPPQLSNVLSPNQHPPAGVGIAQTTAVANP